MGSFDEMPPGRFSKVKVLGPAIFGVVELHADSEVIGPDGQPTLVVMKKLSPLSKVDEHLASRRSNPYGQKGAGGEDCYTEIGVLRRLGRSRCPFVLQSVGCFRDSNAIQLMTEYA